MGLDAFILYTTFGVGGGIAVGLVLSYLSGRLFKVNGEVCEEQLKDT